MKMSTVERELLCLCRVISQKIAKKFKIKCVGVHKLPEGKKHSNMWGLATTESDRGYFEIALKTAKGNYVGISRLVDTICHELAHIATHFERKHHSDTWKQLYKKYLLFAKEKLL